MPSIFWSSPVTFPANQPHNMMLPPLTAGTMFFTLKTLTLFPQSHISDHYGQQLNLYSIWPENSTPKAWWSPANLSLALSLISGFFLVQQPFSLWKHWDLLMVDVHIWYLMSSSPVPLLWGSLEAFRQKFIHTWEFICASCLCAPKILNICMFVCTYACNYHQLFENCS